MRRLVLSLIALLLLVVLGWQLYVRQSETGAPRTWIEVFARPRTVCYQGAPRREVVHLQLWQGGPGVTLMQERQIGLALIDKVVPKKFHDDKAAWSEPVEGVRARLLSPKESYQVGKPLVLTLEIQNVSAAEVSLDEPQLMPLISYPRSHPYRKHSYPWVITCETPESPPHILWGARAARDRVPAQLRLEPGVTHRVEIIGVSLREEIDLDRPRKRGQQQREEVQFVGADDPGVYLFKATFALRAAGEQKGAGRASVWKRRPSGSR